jgi:hypothetical protein
LESGGKGSEQRGEPAAWPGSGRDLLCRLGGGRRLAGRSQFMNAAPAPARSPALRTLVSAARAIAPVL